MGYRLEEIILTIDSIIDTRRKRHVVGGILLSTSLLFGGLAITVMTINGRKDNENEY